MMIQWYEHCEKGVKNRQTDGHKWHCAWNIPIFSLVHLYIGSNGTLAVGILHMKNFHRSAIDTMQ